MEHIFETFYPEYIEFKEKIFFKTQEFLEFLVKMKNKKIQIYFNQTNIKIMNDIVKEKTNKPGSNYSNGEYNKYYLKILNEKYKLFIRNHIHIYEDKYFKQANNYSVIIPIQVFKDYFNIKFEIINNVLHKRPESKENRVSYSDIYGNSFNYSSYYDKLSYRISNFDDLRFNNSYFNFFMKKKYPHINIATFYEDSADFIERIKERYYSLPQVKKEEEEKNKFEEIQKELIELKNQLKIKDEEISKIKDDLDDKNKLLKKILTKL